jgi:hypothetical protein
VEFAVRVHLQDNAGSWYVGNQNHGNNVYLEVPGEHQRLESGLEHHPTIDWLVDSFDTWF